MANGIGVCRLSAPGRAKQAKSKDYRWADQEEDEVAFSNKRKTRAYQQRRARVKGGVGRACPLESVGPSPAAIGRLSFVPSVFA